MTKGFKQVKLCIPLMTRQDGDLHLRLAEAAKQNARSINAEILHRLRQSFCDQDLRSFVTEAVKDAMAARVIDKKDYADFDLISSLDIVQTSALEELAQAMSVSRLTGDRHGIRR